MKWFVLAIKNYAVIKGRTSRKGYWMFFLFYVLFVIASEVLDTILGTTWVLGATWGKFELIRTLYGLFIIVPCNTIVVRRLHDIGKSGKWYMWYVVINVIVFCSYFFFLMVGAVKGELDHAILGLVAMLLIHIPIAGIIILIPLCTRGTPGVNKYGPNPEEIQTEYIETTEEM